MRGTARAVPTPFILIAAIGLAALAGCSRQEPASGPIAMDAADQEQWEIALVEMRIEKNESFTDPEQTPLAPAYRAGFEGLNYYYPEPDLRFRVPLQPTSSPDTVQLQKRKGDHVPYLVRGTVRFRHRGRTHELTVYGSTSPDETDLLWVPFLDESNADATYATGRYLDLAPTGDGMVELDFNYAYNPLCDYDAERFDCVLPPAGNALDFRVEAGEQRFGQTH